MLSLQSARVGEDGDKQYWLWNLEKGRLIYPLLTSDWLDSTPCLNTTSENMGFRMEWSIKKRNAQNGASARTDKKSISSLAESTLRSQILCIVKSGQDGREKTMIHTLAHCSCSLKWRVCSNICSTLINLTRRYLHSRYLEILHGEIYLQNTLCKDVLQSVFQRRMQESRR